MKNFSSISYTLGLIFFLFFGSVLVWANPTDLFKEGNEAYRKGDFAKAISYYSKVKEAGFESCDLHYNTGNAYLNLNQLANAIWHYEKALLISPNDKDIQNNLVFARARTIDQINATEIVGFEKLIQDFTGLLHFDTWAKFSVVLVFLFIALFLLYYFSYSTTAKRVYFVMMMVLPFLFLLCISSAWYEKHLYNSERPAIVFSEEISVKNEPREQASEAFVLHEGTKVFVLEKLDDWRRIRLADDSEGWITKSAIKELKD
jgi:tetratricopeptide (TPR) repeat protein